ncbi:winged helix-turn-helix transcriptional regulator [Actinoplanes sp. TBRC 11911]|uniref:MarR family winged helix-turn-helix transcriptional regulator n=1 Tax=Actinoplanes sp. TBRC 11911 TaxID=2729386 RepID=UPI00145D43A0|nr:MarR family winged helix-turn-helix transcriptional regulator [Actinoplanes sp. TBRC 11911]NMO50031.1 winged helix-turn-helix transcriptional regulator [Actinoplanes sp. TBRC 11911]
METEDRLTAEEQGFFEVLVQRAAVAQRKVDYDLIQETRTTLSEYTTMRCLADAPDGTMRMGDLAAATGVSPTRISRIVEKLAHDDLVVREKPAGDRRRWNVSLSDRGRAGLSRGDHCYAASVRRNFLGYLTPQQLRALVSLLERLPAPRQSDSADRKDFPVQGGDESAW